MSIQSRKKPIPKTTAHPSAARTKKPVQTSPKIPWLWIGLGIVAMILVTAVFLRPDSQLGTVAALPPEISIAQAHEKYKNGVFLLDVRTRPEWDTVHIPNTTLIPLDQLSSRVEELPKDQEIVVVCRSGNRSAEGRDILKAAGFEQVTSMGGGVNAWSAAGYPTE